MNSKLRLGLSRDNQLVTLSLFIWGLGEGLFFFVQPWYIGKLGANPTQIGGALALASLITAVVYLPGGVISDRLDRKTTMVGGYVIGTIAVVIMAAAQHWQTLIPGLLLYAVSSYCIPAIYSYVTHAAEGQDLASTLTTVFAAYSLGLTPSPALGGWLIELIGMRMTYVVSAGFFVAASLTVSLVARQAKPDSTELSTGRGVVRNPTFMALSAIFLIVFFVMYLGQPFAPNYLEEVTGLRLGWIGFLGSAHSLGAFVLGLTLGRWRAGPRWGLIAAQGLVGLSFVLLLRTDALLVLTLAFFTRGAYHTSRSLASAWMGDVLGRHSLGLAFGTLSTVYGIANVLAPYVAGWLYAARPSLPFAVAAAGLPATMALTGVVAFARRPAGRKETRFFQETP